MRIKRGHTKNLKHKKTLKLAKGYRMSYSKLYRRAKEAVRHAGSYSFTHRKHRKSQKREEWIKVISAALADKEISYSKFQFMLKQSKIEIDRKNLADMIINNSGHFDKLVTAVSK